MSSWRRINDLFLKALICHGLALIKYIYQTVGGYFIKAFMTGDIAFKDK